MDLLCGGCMEGGSVAAGGLGLVEGFVRASDQDSGDIHGGESGDADREGGSVESPFLFDLGAQAFED
jgi:hypothetical protein